jgi:hypothetical protein
MKNNWYKIGFLFIVLVFVGASACNEKDPTPDYGTKANIVGEVSLFDEGLIPMRNDSMIVTVVGTNPVITDTTDANGKYVLKDVPYGSYSLSFHKAGYGFHMINNVVHSEGETVVTKTITLGQFSNTHITSLSAKDTLGSILIRISSDPAGTPTTPRHIRVFFHDIDNVSFENFTKNIFLANQKTNPLEYRLNPHALEDMGFKTGETVWIKAYGDSYYSNDYIEPVKGQHIFPNLNMNSAAATSFVVP